MYIEVVPNHGSRPTILLRESTRDGKRTIKRTLANLTHWDPAKVQALRDALRGAAPAGSGTAVPTGAFEDSFEILRSLPHGHVAAVLGTIRRLGIPALLSRKRTRERDLALAVIAARVIDPRSKLATAHGLRAETLESTLAEELGLADADEDAIYAAMDWALTRQDAVEDEFARRHLADGSLVLYDVTSTYFEGHHCPLARRGYSRDGKREKAQIVVGLLTDAEGRPVAVEVFPGNTGDARTVAPQVAKLRERFGIRRIVLVGDRGMLTEARIRDDLRPHEGLDWISALRAPAIRGLVERRELQLSLFDERDMAEITSPQFPGERLVVCRNPLLAEERAKNRTGLLAATQKGLEKVAAAVARAHKPLRGAAAIGARAGKVLAQFKVGKHFEVRITDDSLSWNRREERIAAESALDGIYVVRTSVPAEKLPESAVVRTYKRLSEVERAFRSLKSVDLKIRPIHHRLERRVRAHVFLCMVAFYVEWHMRDALAPLLFDDEYPEQGEAARESAVAPAQRSEHARTKAATRCAQDGLPVQSFQCLLRDLRTLTRNRIRARGTEAVELNKLVNPTPLQQQALDLLGVRL